MFKTLFHCLTLAGQLISTPIYIIYDALNVDTQICRNTPSLPISIQTDYLQVNEANFTNLKNQSIGYRQYDLSCLCTLPMTSQSGILLSSGYTLTNISWDSSSTLQYHDPKALGYFTFKTAPNYHYVQFSVGTYTLAIKNWQWSVMLSSLLDPQHPAINYGLYRAILSGKYHTSDELSVVFGCIQEIGLHQRNFWPILGASYKPTNKLTIDCIYPLNFSLKYQCTNVCDLGAAYRLTRFLKKLPKNSLSSSQGLFEYEGREIEVNMKLIPWPGSFVKLCAGWSLGHAISLANAQNQDKQTHHYTATKKGRRLKMMSLFILVQVGS